jgi:1,2-diacylglycerol 3-alpha-glucosyltransferase
MNILMMTNTYLPHVGGVANSVSVFTKEMQRRGHHVVVVAPEYSEAVRDDPNIIRVPALQHFNGSDFSMMLPIPNFLVHHLENFRPDIVHSHHPFLLGSTAIRISMRYNVPLVFTQHTMFEQYTHYVPMGHKRLKKFVVILSTGYANMSNLVIAPSESIAAVLKSRGVNRPIEVIPTGIHVDKFRHGDGQKIRVSANIPHDAFVIGHLGRLAPEKNLEFLSKAVALFLQNEPKAHFIVVGYGPSEEQMYRFFLHKNLQSRVRFIGKLQNQELIDAYHAMDVFAFSSKSETQGLVLAEAMAAGVPVVALDASGVREVVRDNSNGYLLKSENIQYFANALERIHIMSPQNRESFSSEAKKTAELFSVKVCTTKLLDVYEKLEMDNIAERHKYHSMWEKSIEQIKVEWELLTNFTNAVEEALIDSRIEK